MGKQEKGLFEIVEEVKNNYEEELNLFEEADGRIARHGFH